MSLVGGDASATDGPVEPAFGAASPRTEMPYYRGGALYAYRRGPRAALRHHRGAYGLAPVKRSTLSLQLYHLQRDPAERLMSQQTTLRSWRTFRLPWPRTARADHCAILFDAAGGTDGTTVSV